MGDEITTLSGGESAAAEPSAPSWTEQLPKDHREFASGYEDAPAFAKAFLSKSGAGWEEIDGDPQPWTEQLPKHLRKLKALNDHENLPALAEAFSGLNGEQDPGATEQDPGEKDGKAEPEKAEKPAKRLKGERALFKRLSEVDFKNDPPEVIAAEVDRFNEFSDRIRGVPESADEYTVPDEVIEAFEQMGNELPEELAGDNGRWLAKELGLTKDQHAGLFEGLALLQSMNNKRMAERQEREEVEERRKDDMLKARLGEEKYTVKHRQAERFLRDSLDDSARADLQNSGLLSKAWFKQWIMDVAEPYSEDKIIVGSGPTERNVSPGQQGQLTADEQKYRAVYGNSMG